MSQVVACPKCRKQYRVDDKSIGKNMKCPACQTVFQAKVAASAATRAQSVPAANPGKTAPQQEWARFGLDGPLPGAPQLFPPTAPQGPDPLSNHIVQDPGFAYVDIEQVRKDRIARERKHKKMTEIDPLQKFHDDEAEKRQALAKQRNSGYLSNYTLFEFDGRINRKKFWLSAIFVGLIYNAIMFLILGIYGLVYYFNGTPMPSLDDKNLDLTPFIPLMFVQFIGGCLNLWISLALYIKRYHDLGHPGSRLLLLLIPIIGPFWVLFEVGFQPGQRSTNEYGPDPLGD